MVQQMIDSKFSEYGLTNSETGLPKHDKQPLVPVAAKKRALRDLQNENRSMVTESVGNSLFPKESGPTTEAIKVSGNKRPTRDCLVSTPHHQSPTGNAANEHLVYVRRKSEAEIAKGATCENTRSNANYPPPKKLRDQDETTPQQSQMKNSKNCIPEASPIPRASMMCFSSGKPSVPLSFGKSNNNLPLADSNYLQGTPAIPSLDCPKRMNIHLWEDQYFQLQNLLKKLDQSDQEDYVQSIIHLWEDRYSLLQNLLKKLDQSDQEDYVQMLRSLSSIELSRHAIELEKRSIHISLEEAKEMQRVQLLDVLGKYPKNSRAPSTREEQSEK